MSAEEVLCKVLQGIARPLQVRNKNGVGIGMVVVVVVVEESSALA